MTNLRRWVFVSLIELALTLWITACTPPRDHAPAPILSESGRWRIPERDEDQVAVTRDFGPLVVRAGFREALAWKGWSGPWYPYRERFLLDGRGGQASPLEKYDLASRLLIGKPSRADAFEEDQWSRYFAHSEGWEGLCNAWSAASLLSPEPRRSVPLPGGGFLGVSDLKAILVKSYELVQGLKQYGERFEGTRLHSHWDDIYPDQFHRFIENQLFELNRPFIADLDPERQVWNYPVWYAGINLQADTDNPKIMHAEAWITHSDPHVPPDFVGVRAVSRHYTWDLFGEVDPDGSLRVEYGLWTGDSLDDHPDFVSRLPEVLPASHRSQNSELDPKFIEALISRSL